MNLENKLASSKPIINIQKIEQVIIVWKQIKNLTLENHKQIKNLTLENHNSSLQTIDIPADENIKWNNIKQTPNLQFETIDDLEIKE